MSYIIKGYAKLLLGLPLILACSSAEAPEGAGKQTRSSEALGVTHDAPPLYTIDLGNSAAVYLWEHAPGQINFSESAAVGTTMPHLAYDLTGRVSEIFSTLRPGEAIPDVLASAQVRQDQRLAELAALGELQPKLGHDAHLERAVPPSNRGTTIQDDAPVRLVPKDAWHEWFEDNLCRGDVLAKWPQYGQVEWCALHRANGGGWHFYNKAELLATVMPYTGTVTFKLVVKWNGGSSSSTNQANVSAGYAYAWEFYDDRIVDEHDYDFGILNAEGDSYHRAVVSAWNFCKQPNRTCAPAGIDHCVCGV